MGHVFSLSGVAVLIMTRSKNQREQFNDALREFDAAYDTLIEAEIELNTMIDVDGVSTQLARIAAIKTAVSGMRRTIKQLGDFYAHASPLLGNIAPLLPKSTLTAIRGGTIALTAAHYNVIRFINGVKGETVQLASLMQMAEWGILGAVARFEPRDKTS